MISFSTALYHFPAVMALKNEGKWLFGPAQLSEEEENKRPAIQSMVQILDENGEEVQMDRDGMIEIPEGSVAVIELIGPMRKYGNYYCAGTDDVVFYIRQMMRNQNIKGIILKVDTGGGAVDSIAPLIQEIQARTKPIVALCDLCASAGMYGVLPTDHIMAENNISSEFGSIGVMLSFYSFQEYLKKEGIEEHIIMAPESDFKNRDWLKAREGDYKDMEQFTLSPLAQKFQADVKAFRGSKLNTKVEGILAGRMFYAEDALEHGLIDSIGNMDAAIEMVHRLAAGRELKNATL